MASPHNRSPKPLRTVWISSKLAAALSTILTSTLIAPALIHIPGGEFLMGQADGRDDERPAHCVTVAPFSLGTTALTNAGYDRFCRDTGRTPTKFRHQPDFNDAQHPVTGPSWFDAVAYCEWLSLGTGLHFRLPTEAEWE